MPIDLAEFNTIITFLGCMCATVQMSTGFYAAYKLSRPALLTTDKILSRAHRSFGDFATLLFTLGLFNGINTLVAAIRIGEPPLELNSLSFNIHTWISIPLVGVFIWKTWLSYFDKPKLYKKRRWLGPAMFGVWSFTWITAAISYYVRTLPSNPQHPPPSFLLPYNLMWLQLTLPFVLGGLISWKILGNYKRSQEKEPV